MCRRDDERGNIIVAVIIIMVLFMLCSVAAERAIGDGQVVNNRQSNAVGVASADAGVADGLFRLDQGATATFCSNASDTNCKMTFPVSGGAPGLQYLATRVDSADWTIQAEGMIHGVYGAVQEKVVRTAQYNFALFGASGLDFSGNNTAGFGTYTGGQAYGAGNPNTAGPVQVGSNGTIDCHGGLPPNVTAVYYSKGGGVNGACGSSANPRLYQVPLPSAPTSQGAASSSAPYGCPNAGQLGSNFAGGGNLNGGTYLCRQPITVSGNLTINGGYSNSETDSSASSDQDFCDPSGYNHDTDGDVVCLYVILDPSTYGSGTNAIDIQTGTSDICPTVGTTSCLNVNPTLSGGSPSGTLPDSEQLQVLTNSNGSVGDANGHGFYFGGIMYAPQAQLVGNGCKSTFYGAAVINTLFCHGAPNFSVYYDNNLGSLYGPWTTNGYTQISPSSIVWP
jgi:hypothetical protein